MPSGAFAILIAIAGIYGMSSNAVVLRRHEIGLRRALGASNGNLLASFLFQGARQLALALGGSALLCSAVLYPVLRASPVAQRHWGSSEQPWRSTSPAS